MPEQGTGWGKEKLSSIRVGPFRRSALFHELFIHVAVPPALSGFERANHGVLAAMKMLGGMLVFGGVAAAYVSARQAKPEMNPAVSHLQALLTTIAVRLVVGGSLQVITCVGHDLLPLR